MNNDKLIKALSSLKESLLEREKEGASAINDAGVAKCFEVALEYAWKAVKRLVEDDGLEANSPKESIKFGATIGLIDNPEVWIDFINNRNLSVHDYIGVDNDTYLNSIKIFAIECEKLIEKL